MDNNYVDRAQEIVQKKLVTIEVWNDKLKKKEKKIALTTNQIRKILSAVNVLTNKINRYRVENPRTKILSEELAAEVKYLKVLISYQAGRDDQKPFPVKNFVDSTGIIKIIDEIKDSIDEYYKFNRYVEALVAFHKYEGGK